MTALNWFVAHIGSREHYMIPRAFHSRNRLNLLYTEAWCRHARSLVSLCPGDVSSLASRFHTDVPGEKVVSFTPTSLAMRARRSLKLRVNTIESEARDYVRMGQWFASRVNSHLRRQNPNKERDAFLGFCGGCLETLQLLRDHGVSTIVDQVDPARVNEETALDEVRKWPGWTAMPGRVPDIFWQRLHAEWELASLVLVNSRWSQAALIRQGVPAEKIIVVPLSYQPESQLVRARTNAADPLRVLWLGRVCLLKGIQYLIQAATQLARANVRFIVAGSIDVSKLALATAPPNMSFLGRIPRNLAPAIYREADVFVMPTLSDGFAITQIEAMAYGLPVITTPNCGDVVTDGVDGFIVPAGDSRSLANAILKFDHDRRLLTEASRRAVLRSKDFSLNTWMEGFDAAVSGAFRSPQRQRGRFPYHYGVQWPLV